MKDPVLSIKDLIDTNFVNNTNYTDTIDVHTGWYGENAVDPQITVTNPEEFTVNGGDTEISAGGNNEKVQVRAGDILVNCWGGVRDHTGGNPKQQAYDMRDEVKDILTGNSISHLNSIAPGTIRGIAEPDHPPGFTYRYEIRTRYTYIK